MSTSSERKATFLGMPFGTANARLRKMILFRLIQKCGEDVCFKCGMKIEHVNDLSIEHKEPWEGRSIDLFWDLDNIAFSHIRCNLPHRIPGGFYKRKIGPEGTAWCCGCQQFKSKSLFHRNRSNWHGVSDYCRQCAVKFIRDDKP